MSLSASLDCSVFTAVCRPVYQPDIGARASIAGRNAVGAWASHGDGGVAGDGAERGATLRALTSGAEPGAMVDAPGVRIRLGLLIAMAPDFWRWWWLPTRRWSGAYEHEQSIAA